MEFYRFEVRADRSHDEFVGMNNLAIFAPKTEAILALTHFLVGFEKVLPENHVCISRVFKALANFLDNVLMQVIGVDPEHHVVILVFLKRLRIHFERVLFAVKSSFRQFSICFTRTVNVVLQQSCVERLGGVS